MAFQILCKVLTCVAVLLQLAACSYFSGLKNSLSQSLCKDSIELNIELPLLHSSPGEITLFFVGSDKNSEVKRKSWDCRDVLDVEKNDDCAAVATYHKDSEKQTIGDIKLRRLVEDHGGDKNECFSAVLGLTEFAFASTCLLAFSMLSWFFLLVIIVIVSARVHATAPRSQISLHKYGISVAFIFWFYHCSQLIFIASNATFGDTVKFFVSVLLYLVSLVAFSTLLIVSAEIYGLTTLSWKHPRTILACWALLTAGLVCAWSLTNSFMFLALWYSTFFIFCVAVYVKCLPILKAYTIYAKVTHYHSVQLWLHHKVVSLRWSLGTISLYCCSQLSIAISATMQILPDLHARILDSFVSIVCFTALMVVFRPRHLEHAEDDGFFKLYRDAIPLFVVGTVPNNIARRAWFMRPSVKVPVVILCNALCEYIERCKVLIDTCSDGLPYIGIEQKL